MFRARWLRRLIRRNTRPIPTDTAGTWKQRVSIAYLLIAWNAFGFVCYMAFTGRRDWAESLGYKSEADRLLSPGRQWAKTLRIENAKIIRLSGVAKVEETVYVGEKDDE